MSFEILRLHLARSRAREESKRQALQMAEDRGAQIVHHTLADLIGKEGLDHAEHAGRDRDRDDPSRVQRERRRIVPPDRLEHILEQERRNDTEPGGDHDQHQDSTEPQLVRREEPADAVQVRAAYLWVGRSFRRRIGRVKEHPHRRSGYAPVLRQRCCLLVELRSVKPLPQLARARRCRSSSSAASLPSRAATSPCPGRRAARPGRSERSARTGRTCP